MSIQEFEQFLAELDDNIVKLDQAAQRTANTTASAEAQKLRTQRDSYVERFFAKLTPWDNV
ncbi:hypothetical protein, partial [Armatimonas sp.]|uniref:hypothetical protein n=1 Tax=Armatimonas sp. TaxID=1872638 RepID=UPI003753D87B